MPFTRTESQPVIPLITFVTEVYSTFGFWLGFSVSDFFHLAKKIWQKVKIARDKLRSRERLVQRPFVNRRILNTVTRLQQVSFLSKHRLLKRNKIAQKSAD